MKSLATLLSLAIAIPASAIDLVPSYTTVFAEGIALQRPYFADGGRKFGVTIDSETEVRPWENGAIFRFTPFPLEPLAIQAGCGLRRGIAPKI
jgi:hypothetical protein